VARQIIDIIGNGGLTGRRKKILRKGPLFHYCFGSFAGGELKGAGNARAPKGVGGGSRQKSRGGEGRRRSGQRVGAGVLLSDSYQRPQKGG